MAKTELLSVVCDAGPLIHLDELQCLDLLEYLGEIALPRVVWNEVKRHRPLLLQDALSTVRVVDVVGRPSKKLSLYRDSLDLDAGELAAITLMESLSAQVFLTDDAAARLAAESLGFTVRGTIGILVRAIRVGCRTREQILGLLQELPHRSSLYFSRRLLQKVVAEVEGLSSQ
jgi:predicted nucleic acid-binding protein